MDRFNSVPKSPMTDTPICDSDEEVFFGPVTSKELTKASQLKRRTQLYFPTFNWKPSTSDNNAAFSSEDTNKGSDTVDRANLSLSADSLETESFVTLSDKQEDSSKGEFCSALSGNTSNSQTSLNEAHFYSKISEDSLESDKPEGKLRNSSHTPRKASSAYSNISEDSLENTEHAFNAARLHSVLSGNTWNSSEAASEEPHTSQSGSEGGFNNDSLLSTPKVGPNGQLLKPGCLRAKSHTSTYEVLPEMEDNETYTIDDDSCEVVEQVEPSSVDLSDEVPVDKDGGFLSILSEAALYHASQLKENEKALSHGVKECSGTQSLEDRFKTFGIGGNDLEEQQLSNSIMYMTGRESNILPSETETNTFYTGVNSGPGSSFSSEEQYDKKSMGNLTDCSGSSSYQYDQESAEYDERGVVNVTSGSEGTTSSKLQYSNVLNQPISNGTLGSAGSTFQSSGHEALQTENENEVMEQTGSYVRESLGISGVYRLNSMSESQSNSSIQSCNDSDVPNNDSDVPNNDSDVPNNDSDVPNNDSDVSSYAGELNDTLEEYEMMMRYGVEYILGRKGNKKGEHAEKEQDCSKGSPSHHQSSPSMHHRMASPHTQQPNSSASSAEYLDAVDVSPSLKQTTSSRTKAGISPLQKQLFKRTPQKIVKDMPGASSKGSSVKIPSKLPRVATRTPTKLNHMTSPKTPKQFIRPVISSSESKITSNLRRPVTPSSEPKVGVFKKPVTPAAGGSRIPKTFAPHHAPKPNKILDNIQSPVGAYIHNSPSPVLVTNVKSKCTDRTGFEKEMHARALWRAGEIKSSIPKPCSQVSNMENVNPNVGCGLPSVKYTKAPCVKWDEARLPVPKGGEKISKLMDAPSPQVIKHEGRVRVNCGSPQLAARMHSMAETFDDSLMDVHSVSGDISVCVSQQACRTYTLGNH